MAEAVRPVRCRIYSDRRSLEDTAETHKSPTFKNKYEHEWVCVYICPFFFLNTSSLIKSQQGPPSGVELKNKSGLV